MRRTRLFFALLFLLASPFALAKVVYVDVNASGAVQDGTSWSTAFQDLSRGAAAAVSGDEVWVANGDYYSNPVIPPAGVALYGGFAGTETQREQRDWRVNAAVLHVDVVECRFDGVRVDGFSAVGMNPTVWVSDGTASLSHITTSGSTGSGVRITSGTVTLTDSAVSFAAGGVQVEGGTAVLSNNTFTKTFTGVYMSSGTLLLTNNDVVNNNNDGVHILGGTAMLTGNIISGNRGHGVNLGGTATLTNNTLYGNTGLGVFVNSGPTDLYNNIIAFNGGGLGKGFSGSIAVFSHNNVHGNTYYDYNDYTPPADQGNLSVDPLFVGRTNGDYHLQAGSPAINAGDDAAVTPGSTDRDGKPRILGAQVDMGAYEFADGTVPYTLAEAAGALKVAAGLVPVAVEDMARLNVATGDTSSHAIDLLDAIRIARKVAGLEANE